MKSHTPLTGVKLHNAVEHIAHLASAFDLLSEHVIITDSDAHIIYANGAAVQSTGYSFPEMLGKNPADLWGGHMSQKFYQDMWKRMKTEKKPFSAIVQNVNGEGEEVWQELRISPVLNEQGEIDFFVGIEGVVTGHVQKDVAREDATSLISHEALSPLTAVRWHLEWILERGNLPEPLRTNIQELLEHTERTITILHDLATLSRMGKGHPSFEAYNLGDALQQLTTRDHPFWKCTIQGSCIVHTIPSLATESLSSFLSAIEVTLKEGVSGDIVVSHADNHCTIHLQISSENLQSDIEPDLRIPILIAKYLHWDTIRHYKTDAGEEWSMSIPCSVSQHS